MSLFVKKGLYTEADIKNFIMNCDSSYHDLLWEAIYDYADDLSDQYVDSCDESDYSSRSEYIKQSVRTQEYDTDF